MEYTGDKPLMVWRGKHDSNLKHDVKITFTERIDPSKLLRPIIGNQLNLHGEKKKISYDAENQLICGESVPVMQSLRKNKDMKGKIQMIYYDPPYGIKYDSDYVSVKEGVGNKVTAFRDKYTDGINSYLSIIYDNLKESREMLDDSGSIFLQISEINVHKVRMLLDEIYGAENFVWDILYQTKTGAGTPYPNTCDYILWYAKDKQVLKNSGKMHKLYLDRTQEQLRSFNRIHLQDGTVVSIKGKIPKGGRLCKTTPLFSQHMIGSDRKNPHTFQNGIMIKPSPYNHWRVSHDALDKLYDMGRLYFSKNGVSQITYMEDYPVKVTNLWAGMGIIGEKIYDVQTKTTVVERCILMTTNPGDLVLDITCGSGVTPYIAEKHGRRWIGIDISKLAINIASNRLQTAIYDWHVMNDEKLGIDGGFKYESFVKLTASTLADHNKRVTEYRYERPLIIKGRLRACSSYMINYYTNTGDKPINPYIDALLICGIITPTGRKYFDNLQHIDDNFLYGVICGQKYVIHVNINMTNKEKFNSVLDEIKEMSLPINVKKMFMAESFYPGITDTDAIYVEINKDMKLQGLMTAQTDRPYVQLLLPKIKINGKITLEGFEYMDMAGNNAEIGTEYTDTWMVSKADVEPYMPDCVFHIDEYSDRLKLMEKKLKLTNEIINSGAFDMLSGFEFPNDRQNLVIKTIDKQGIESWRIETFKLNH